MQKKKKLLIMLGFFALVFLTSFGFSKLQPKKSEAKMSGMRNLDDWVGKEIGSTEVTDGWIVEDPKVNGKTSSEETNFGEHWILWSQVDKKSTSADTFWHTESYIVTEKKIADKNYNIGNGGAQFKQERIELCSKNLPDGEIWTLHGTPYKPLRKAIDEEQSIHPYHFRENVKDGVVTVWVQPVMMTSVNGKVKKGIKDLKTWQDTNKWSKEYTFKNHYDKIVQFKDNDKEAIQVKVHYVKRDGEEIDTKQKIIDSNVIKNVQIGKTIKLGDKLKNLKGDSIDVLNDHCEIKDKDGKKYVISKTFARFAKSKEQQDFVGSQTGSVADAKTDKDKKVLAKTTTGINADMTPESGKELPLDKWFGFVKSAKVRGSLQDLEIFLCYDEVKEEESGITVNYKKIVYPKGSDKAEFVKAKNSWKVKKADIPKLGEVWSHSFSQTLKSEGDPYFGFKCYKVTYKGQKKKIESRAAIANNDVFYDTFQWKSIVKKVSKIKLEMPKEDVTIDVFYQAKLPAIVLIYDTSDKDKIKLVKATPMKARLDVGKTNKKTVSTTMPGDNKKKITSIAVSSGDIKGAFGATSNGYKENKLPSNLKTIKKDCSDLTGESYQVSFEMQSKPTYLVVTYGGNPLEPDPEKDPDPDKNSSNKPKTIDLNEIKVTTVGTPSDVVTPFEVTLPPTPTNASDSKDAMDGVRNIDAIGKIEANKTKNQIKFTYFHQ